jgi:hypothetical protein
LKRFLLESKGVLPFENCSFFMYFAPSRSSIHQCLCKSISKQKQNKTKQKKLWLLSKSRIKMSTSKEDFSSPINIYSYVHDMVLYLLI